MKNEGYNAQKRRILCFEEAFMIRDAVQASLEKIRGMLQADGGDVELVDVSDDGVVKVRLTGRCGSCPMSQMTLKMGVERQLKSDVPGVHEVINV